MKKHKYIKAIIIALVAILLNYFFEESYTLKKSISSFCIAFALILIIEWVSKNPQKIDRKEDD